MATIAELHYNGDARIRADQDFIIGDARKILPDTIYQMMEILGQQSRKPIVHGRMVVNGFNILYTACAFPGAKHGVMKSGLSDSFVCDSFFVALVPMSFYTSGGFTVPKEKEYHVYMGELNGLIQIEGYIQPNRFTDHGVFAGSLICDTSRPLGVEEDEDKDHKRLLLSTK